MKSILCLALLLVCASHINAAGTFRSQTELDTNDLKVLNYAVFLERLGAAFYAYGQSTFNASQFASAGYSSTVYNYFGMIAQHEAAHRDLLQTTVTSLGGTLPASCNYNFSSVQTVAQYVTTARQLESLDVQAYLGAASGLNSRLLLQVAATITTVEARHASFLGNLTGTGPFTTSAFDTPLGPTDVLPLAANTGFLNGCTYPTANLPTVLQVSPDFASLVYLNSSLLSNGTSIANIDQSAITANEIKVLNYALFLERLEADFYNNFTNSYSRDQFGTATGFPGFVYDYLVLIRDHENAHVNFLVGQLGSNALPSCSFTYPNLVGNVTAYLVLAQVFENLGVTAYDGAIAAIHTRDTAQAAATIATIEARHAAFLNELVGSIPFSADRDTANTPTTVAGAALTYTICPAGAVPTLPDFFALVPKANATGTTQAPGTSTTTKAPNTNSSNSVVLCLSMLIMCIATLVL